MARSSSAPGTAWSCPPGPPTTRASGRTASCVWRRTCRRGRSRAWRAGRPARGDISPPKPAKRIRTYPVTGVGPGPSIDVGLVREVAAGSHDALADLYDRHADAVFASAYRLTSDRGLAEEVVQETFLALWNRADTFDPSVGSLAAWLHTIARNRTVDRLRAAGRRPTLVPLSSAAASGSAFGGGPEPDADALERVLANGTIVAGAAPPRSPDMEVALVELREALQAALAEMPEVERVVIVLAYGEDLTQTEIADRLGWPLGTVKTRTRRALLRLRDVLGSGVGPEFTRYLARAPLAGPDH